MITSLPSIQQVKREQLKAYLKDSMFWNQTLFENNRDALFALDIEGHCMWLNPACTKITGYTAVEAAQLDFSHLIKADELDRVSSFFQQTLKGNFRTYDCSIITKDGKHVDLQVTNIPISVNDEIVGVYGVAKDITEIKLNRKRLQTGEKLNRTLTEKSLDMMTKTDLNGYLLFVSPASQSILGYPPQELVGTPSSNIIYAEDVKRLVRSGKGLYISNVLNGLRAGFVKKMEVRFGWMYSLFHWKISKQILLMES